MIRIRDISLPPDGDMARLVQAAARQLRISPNEIKQLDLKRRSVDARKKNDVRIIYTVDVAVKGREDKILKMAHCARASLAQDPVYHVPQPRSIPAQRPVIVGFGPAGMFAALVLSMAGLRPLVLERGQDAKTRHEAVSRFWQTGELDPECNVQFGEGGAGTFSDGKLTTRIGDELCGFVTEVFLQHGAPAEIAWKQKPHVGTDLLRGVITSIRKEIESLGGEVHFNTALTGLEQKNGHITGIFTTDGSFACEALVFAVGHSARDTFAMLMDSGLVLECKPFSVGFRAEHLQSEIEKSLYHEAAGHPALPRGEYQLSQHVGERCVYTFCMCPGGQVVASASEEGRVVTNGMSEFARDKENINGALLVNVTPEDFGGDSPLAGIAFQRDLEAAAYQAGQGNYLAPAQRVEDFLVKRPSTGPGRVIPSYRPGVTWTNLWDCLPDFVAASIAEALPILGRKLKGYDQSDAVLTAVESRSSSPVRLLRNNDRQSPIQGLYPCGEGGGWAGGILSAAADGMRCGEEICKLL